MSKAKTNTISGSQLACLFVITRLASGLLTTSVSIMQLLCEIAFSAGLSLLAFCFEKLGIKVPFTVVSAVFFALAVWDCATYIEFTKKVAHPEIPIVVIVLLLAAFSVYAGALGLEATARFSVLALLLVSVCVLTALVTNIPAFRRDFFAYSEPERISLLSLLKCLDIPLLYTALSSRTNGKKGRALIIGHSVSYIVIIAVILSCRAVLGKTAYDYSSPIFALFQLAKAGLFTKLDILYICTILILLFCELSVSVSALKFLVNKEGKQ